MGENDDKHIMISERYSIEQDLEETKGRKEKVEESKEYQALEQEDLDVHIGVRNYILNDLMVERPDLTPESKNEQSIQTLNRPNIRQSNRDPNELSRIRKDMNMPQIKRELNINSASDLTNNNNLDLKSLYNESNKTLLKESDNDPDTLHDSPNKACMFSELSKDYNAPENNMLSHTLDICSLTKLRRMFGSERLIREYRTSEESSQFMDSNGHDLRLNSGDYKRFKINHEISEERFKSGRLDYNRSIENSKYNIKDIEDDDIKFDRNDLEIIPSDLTSDEKHFSIQNQIPESFIHSNQNDEKDNVVDQFMGTNELLDLFTSEGIKKTIESSDTIPEHTVALFNKNPFKDFTMTKMNEVLKDKDYDQIQELRKVAIDYRASVEKKLLSKLDQKESPRALRSRRLEIEKWVDNELQEIAHDTDIDNMRQKTLNTICDTNLQTERIHAFIQKMNSSQSASSNLIIQDKPSNEKKTIDELLKTDSEQSPFDEGIDKLIRDGSYNDPLKTPNSDPAMTGNIPSLNDTKSDNTCDLIQKEDEKGYEDMNISETTQELIEKNYDDIFNKNNAKEITGEKNKIENIIRNKESQKAPEIATQTLHDHDQIQHSDSASEKSDEKIIENEKNEERKIIKSEIKGEDAQKVVAIGPLEFSNDDATSSEENSGIMVTEVNLVTPEK